MSSQLEDAFNEAVEQRTAELRAALEFYANADNYVGGEVGWWADAPGGEHRWCMDFGPIARSALVSPDRPPFFTEQQERALARCEGYEEGIAAASPDERPTREAIEALPRWIAVEQAGYDANVNGPGPVMHAAVLLDDVLGLLAAPSHRGDEAAGTPAAVLNTEPSSGAASPDERLREALREIVAAFPSPPDREMDDEEIEKWYADHGDWFQRLAALAAADREAPDEETKR